MKAHNLILTEEDEALLTHENLKIWADYQGDHERLLLLRAMARKLLLLENPLMQPYNVAQFLDGSVDSLTLSVRTATTIKVAGYRTVRDVYEAGWARLMRMRNFGERSRLELVDLFARFGLIWQEGICDAPKPVDGETQITCPMSLYNDLLLAARQDLEHFELKHGRFASRGKNVAEHTRLQNVVKRAQALINQVTDNDD
ncbi:DNA-directed RNA polymerase subunit alpha C-terminal domain-containing protein [Salmonella enterica]